MLIKTNNYLFGYKVGDSLLIDYATPNLINNLFAGKSITRLENAEEFLTKADFEKINKLVLNALGNDKMLDANVKIKGNTYKVFASGNKLKFILALQKVK